MAHSRDDDDNGDDNSSKRSSTLIHIHMIAYAYAYEYEYEYPYITNRFRAIHSHGSLRWLWYVSYPIWCVCAMHWSEQKWCCMRAGWMLSVCATVNNLLQKSVMYFVRFKHLTCKSYPI